MAGETDCQAVVKSWNGSVSQGAKLVGGKMLSVKFLMDLAPKQMREDIIRSVSLWGWEGSPWTDDLFSSKKIYPGTDLQFQGCVVLLGPTQSYPKPKL